MNIRELLKAKADKIAEADALFKAAQDAKRPFTAEEDKRYDAIVVEVAQYESMIAKAQALTGTNGTWQVADTKPLANEDQRTSGKKEAHVIAASKTYNEAFYAMLRMGRNNIGPEFQAAIGEGVGTGGEVLVPTELDSAIIKQATADYALRGLAKVISTSSTRDFVYRDTVATAAWFAAGTAGSGNTVPQTSPTYGKKTVGAKKGGCAAVVDNELLQDSAFNLQAELSEQFGDAKAILEESAFINGAVGGPSGILADEDLVTQTTASPTAFTSDELIDLQGSLKSKYDAGSSWLMKKSTALAIRKMKNSVSGDYIWQPGLQNGTPAYLLGSPVFYSDYMPTVAATKVPILYGDFRAAFVICDRVPPRFKVLNELYANTDQVGFQYIFRTDGVLVLPEAIAGLKMKAA